MVSSVQAPHSDYRSLKGDSGSSYQPGIRACRGDPTLRGMRAARSAPRQGGYPPRRRQAVKAMAAGSHRYPAGRSAGRAMTLTARRPKFSRDHGSSSSPILAAMPIRVVRFLGLAATVFITMFFGLLPILVGATPVEALPRSSLHAPAGVDAIDNPSPNEGGQAPQQGSPSRGESSAAPQGGQTSGQSQGQPSQGQQPQGQPSQQSRGESSAAPQGGQLPGHLRGGSLRVSRHRGSSLRSFRVSRLLRRVVHCRGRLRGRSLRVSRLWVSRGIWMGQRNPAVPVPVRREKLRQRRVRPPWPTAVCSEEAKCRQPSHSGWAFQSVSRLQDRLSRCSRGVCSPAQLSP